MIYYNGFTIMKKIKFDGYAGYGQLMDCYTLEYSNPWSTIKPISLEKLYHILFEHLIWLLVIQFDPGTSV